MKLSRALFLTIFGCLLLAPPLRAEIEVSSPGQQAIPLALTSLLPLDVPWCLRRLIEHVRPRAFLVSETDLWPNLLLELGKRGVPSYLVNGRLSPSMARSWSRFRPMGRPALDALRLAFVQGVGDRRTIFHLFQSTQALFNYCVLMRLQE